MSSSSGATGRHGPGTQTSGPLDKSTVAFISGPLNPTDDFFNTHYKPRIDKALASGHSLVVGPVPGIDQIAVKYVLSLDPKVDPQRITVYMAHFEYATDEWRRPHEELGVKIKCVGDEKATTRDRDAKMTEDSGYDILRYVTVVLLQDVEH
jgi:hypothetical protein